MPQILTNYNLGVMAPELVILSAAALLSLLDLFLSAKVSRKWIGILSLLAVLGAGVFAGMQWNHAPYKILGDTYRLDALSVVAKLLLLGGTALVILFSLSQDEKEIETRGGEYYYLLLTALLGAMVMVSSADLITLFVGLELLSLSSYILVGIYKKRLASNEAAWKYVVLGSVSSAFILYGMSFLYGLSGSTNLFTIQQRLGELLQSGGTPSMLLIMALFVMMVGFGFKIATAPFHAWTPDVYQGAPTPITSFLAVVSKTAAFVFVMRILVIDFIMVFDTKTQYTVAIPLLMIVAALSMIVGNTVAIRQTNAKRLMAYSSIAQAGYILVPLALPTVLTLPSMFYYLLVYLFMTIGAFTVIHLVSRAEGSEELSAFAGLHQRSRWLAATMTIFLLSLAGLPVTAGFFGKMYLIAGTVGVQPAGAYLAKYPWLAGVMLLTTVISYYYYFGIIRQMYFRSAPLASRIPVPWSVGVVTVICLAGVLVMGIWPDTILHALNGVNWGSGFTAIPSTQP